MNIHNTIHRIKFMEQLLDEIQEIYQNTPEIIADDLEVKEKIRKLENYLDSGQWLKDYKYDEAGKLPADIKRGVLSEDALYNLLTDVKWNYNIKEHIKTRRYAKMKKVNLGTTGLQVPAIAVGCMRLNSLDLTNAAKHIENAIAHDVNFFDHADIYGRGECEVLFGKALKMTEIKREDIFVQSKCGIIPGAMFNQSKEHIIKSVDQILKRLDMEYLDSLLLHRPDALVEPEEVAEAFDELESAGKVRYFGVSNMKPMQIELLKKCVKQPLVANQLQVSVAHSSMIGNGTEVNMLTNGAIDRDGSILDYCRVKDITIQAWSPFQYGMIEGAFFDNNDFAALNMKLIEIGEKYDVSATTMAVAWLLRHPANMQVLAGTMNADRFNEICKACDVQLSRADWYQIYLAAGNMLP